MTCSKKYHLKPFVCRPAGNIPFINHSPHGNMHMWINLIFSLYITTFKHMNTDEYKFVFLWWIMATITERKMKDHSSSHKEEINRILLFIVNTHLLVYSLPESPDWFAPRWNGPAGRSAGPSSSQIQEHDTRESNQCKPIIIIIVVPKHSLPPNALSLSSEVSVRPSYRVMHECPHRM